MKKLIVTTLALGGGLLLAASANAVITGSAHDFSGTGWTPGNQICVACHTPHNAMAVTDAPLWNHELSTATYTLYSTPTFDAADPAYNYGQPSATSKLCLSCHDGSVALENFGGTTGGTTFVTGDAQIGGGGDMSDHHPVSFDYTPALAAADGELWDPTTTASGVVGSTGGSIDEDMLFATQLQCASCHDVHNTNTAGDALLRKGNSGSALCLTCHNK